MAYFRDSRGSVQALACGVQAAKLRTRCKCRQATCSTAVLPLYRVPAALTALVVPAKGGGSIWGGLGLWHANTKLSSGSRCNAQCAQQPQGMAPQDSTARQPLLALEATLAGKHACGWAHIMMSTCCCYLYADMPSCSRNTAQRSLELDMVGAANVVLGLSLALALVVLHAVPESMGSWLQCMPCGGMVGGPRG